MPKSMEMFFIDNQGTWPEHAQLIGDLIAWPDNGKFPAFIPIAMASHPDFDGRIVAMAGNRGLVISFCDGDYSDLGVRTRLSSKTNPPKQYRLAVDGIIHRLVLAGAGEGALREETAAHGHEAGVHPAALLNWLCTVGKDESALIRKALRTQLQHADGGDEFKRVEELLEQMPVI